MTIIRAFAAAKINLTLHVTGQRADGYHLLDSLVVFADVGDQITVQSASETSFHMSGPMAVKLPKGGDNLVVQAAQLIGVQADIHLTKNLPVAAGMGGGSSDAAACLRALSQLENTPVPQSVAQQLGADVPICLGQKSARMTGIGENVTPISGLPPLYAVLVNPGVGVPTPLVFKALKEKNNPVMPMDIPPQGFIAWLAQQRNDLEGPAIQIQPVITEVLAALAGLKNPLLVRMSGSGASCFALFATFTAASEQAAALRQSHPKWWVKAARLGDQNED